MEKVKWTEHNDLVTIDPKLVKCWEPNNHQKPDEVSTTSDKAFWWVCKSCGRRYKASVKSLLMGKGCPYDTGMKI